MELISREEAIKAIRAIKEVMLTNAEVINALFHVPIIIDTNATFAIGTGSKEGRPPGKWEERQDVPHCNNCGEEAITEWNETGGAWILTPFCPFCGTKMERAKEATDD